MPHFLKRFSSFSGGAQWPCLYTRWTPRLFVWRAPRRETDKFFRTGLRGPVPEKISSVFVRRPWARVPGLWPLLAGLLFLGAGCFGLGGGSGADGSVDGGTWKSVDAGVTWAQAVAVPTSTGVSSSAGTSILSLATDPSDAQAIYAGTERDGLLFTYDGGASWRQSEDTQMRAGAVTAIAVDPTEKCRVYAAKGDRILRTDDCNRTYPSEVYVETKPGVIVLAVVMDWSNPTTVYAALSDGSILKSSDRGTNWSRIYRAGQAITSFIVSHGDSNVLLAGTAGTGIARSADGGVTWEAVGDTLRPYRDATRVIGFAQDAQGRAIYVSSYYGILRSTDQGVSWEPLNLLTAPNEVLPGALAVDPVDPNTILYSVGNSLYRSTDAGVNWAVQKLPTTRAISVITFNRTNSNTLYLGVRKMGK